MNPNELDEGVRNLVIELNNVGIKTLFSCEGSNLDETDAYITIDTRSLLGWLIDRDSLTFYWKLPTCRSCGEITLERENNGYCEKCQPIIMEL